MKYLYYFFHKKTNDKTDGGLVNIPADTKDWPQSWKDIDYKEYNFFNKLKLNNIANGSLFSILQKRNSDYQKLVDNQKYLNKDSISYILKCAYGEIYYKGERAHRSVPSGGQRYPLEIYLYVFNDIQDIKSGIYHYNIKNNLLDIIIERTFNKEDKKQLIPDFWFADANCLICITNIFDRTNRKYGNRGYRFSLLEAGHIGQNIQLSAIEKSIVTRGSGGANEDLIEKQIGLNSFVESLIYPIAF